jgi:hypothetical protein
MTNKKSLKKLLQKERDLLKGAIEEEEEEDIEKLKKEINDIKKEREKAIIERNKEQYNFWNNYFKETSTKLSELMRSKKNINENNNKTEENTAKIQNKNFQESGNLIKDAAPLLKEYLGQQTKTREAEREAIKAEKVAAEEKAEVEKRATIERAETERRNSLTASERAKEDIEKSKDNLKQYLRNTKVGQGLDKAAYAKEYAKEMGSNINSGLNSMGKGLKNAGERTISTGWQIIKGLIFLAIILIILFMAGLMLYSAQAQNCAEFREPGLQGWGALRADYGNPEFRSCAFDNIFSTIGITFQKQVIDKDISVHIMDFINQQVYRATGDYYYSNVDQNREPVGVFIESLSLNDRYYTDEATSISADINVKTFNERLTGELNCFIDNRLHDYMTPSDGKIAVEQSTPINIQCGFEKDRFLDSGRKKLEIKTLFEFATFAYMSPSVIRQSVWQNLTDTQRKNVNVAVDNSLLRTTNAPVQIGGQLGSIENSIVIINDRPDSLNQKEVPFGMTIIANNQKTTWDEGEIKSIKNLIITIPNNFKLREEEIYSDNLIQSCVGYIFKKSEDCNILNEYLDDEQDYRYLCMEGDRIYILDQSGSNPKLENIKTFRTLQCTLEADVEEIFKGDNSEQLGFNQIGIKIYTDYEYTVNRISYLNFIKRTTLSHEQLKTYTCTGVIQESANKSTKINEERIDKYKKIQNTYRRHLPLSMPESEKVRLEAMIAAITYKFSGLEATNQNDLNNNGIIDYLTGCLGTTSLEVRDNHDRQIQCLISELNDILRINVFNIEKTFETYYNRKEDFYETDKQANIQDYYDWLGVLCNIKHENVNQSNENNQEESNLTPGTSRINDACSTNNDCASFNCDETLKKCFDCDPNNDKCPNEYTCNSSTGLCEIEK